MGNRVIEEWCFGAYLGQLAAVTANVDRHEPLSKYCTGLLFTNQRKNVERMAAQINPRQTRAEHQSMHHFVAHSPWSDEEVLRVARELALPSIQSQGPIDAWVVDDTGIPKKGRHSVGVANQYCGVLGKNANCQVAVSVSVANDWASLPVAHRLYLPQSWTDDRERCETAGVPRDIAFETKWQIALGLIDRLLNTDVPRSPVVADAAFGDVVAFRDGLTSRHLLYTVGISKSTTVWGPGKAPLPPRPDSGEGRPPTRARRTAEHKPVSVLELARSLPAPKWRTIRWREGTQGPMRSRFAAVRVRPAPGDHRGADPRPKQWLLVEWPAGETEPTRYWFSTLTQNAPRRALVASAKARWRIERDYQELKDEIGLDHYQGRGWRGFHHHISLCIAAYAYLVAERARLSPQFLRQSLPSGSLPYPQVSDHGELPPRPERHQPTSIRTMRILLTQQLIRRLERCPHCRQPFVTSSTTPDPPPAPREPSPSPGILGRVARWIFVTQ